MLPLKNGRIWILGTGGLLDATLPNSIKGKLGAVTAVYSHIREDRAIWLPRELQGAEFISLSGAYTNVEDRLDNYVRAATSVVNGAARPTEVAFYTYGSPVAFDRVVDLIRTMAFDRDIDCNVVPATSSVDTVLAFLGEDMAPGIQICEARWLVEKQIELDPKLPSFLFQIGAFWSDGITSMEELRLEKLEPLRRYLSTQYPTFNPALFVRAPSELEDSGYVRGVLIADLSSGGSPADLMGTSLYIPSVADPHRKSRLWWRKCFSPKDRGL